VEILEWLCEVMCRKRLKLQPTTWILHHDNASVHKVLYVKQCLTQKSITEKEHPPSSPDLAPIDFWLFPKIKMKISEY
jgi:hypothetical protein